MQVILLRPLFIKFSLLVFITLSLGACKTYSDDDKASFDKTIEQYIAKKKDWKMTKSTSGLYLEVLQEGTGDEPVIFGSEVTIAYKGQLLNGKVFDKKTIKAPLKSNLKGLIMAFQEGLLGQKAGAKLRMVVPPHLGYADNELEGIPANSVLVFEVELVEVY
ncbi:MAG: FKBP-type peptidyl-prolyl cis-trans isomerase [Bacteroidota bacterium]